MPSRDNHYFIEKLHSIASMDSGLDGVNRMTKEAAIQCDRQETAHPKLTLEIGVQMDSVLADVMEDLREQVIQLTKIVADLTSLKVREDRKDTSIPLLGEGILSDSLSDIVPFDSADIPAALETPPPPEPVNPPCFVQDPVLQNIPASASQTQALPPRPPLNSHNNDAPSFPMRFATVHCKPERSSYILQWTHRRAAAESGSNSLHGVSSHHHHHGVR